MNTCSTVRMARPDGIYSMKTVIISDIFFGTFLVSFFAARTPRWGRS